MRAPLLTTRMIARATLATCAVLTLSAVARASLFIHPVIVNSSMPFNESGSGITAKTGFSDTFGPFDIDYVLVAEVIGGSSPSLTSVAGTFWSSLNSVAAPSFQASFTPSTAFADSTLTTPGTLTASSSAFGDTTQWTSSYGSFAGVSASSTIHLNSSSPKAGSQFILGSGHVSASAPLMDGLSFGFTVAGADSAGPGTVWTDDAPRANGVSGSTIFSANASSAAIPHHGEPVIIPGGIGPRLALVGRTSVSTVVTRASTDKVVSIPAAAAPSARGTGVSEEASGLFRAAYDQAVPNITVFVQVADPNLLPSGFVQFSGTGALAGYNAFASVRRTLAGFSVPGAEMNSMSGDSRVAMLGGSAYRNDLGHSWSNPDSFYGSTPNMDGAVAVFGINSTAPVAVNVDIAARIGTLSVDSPHYHNFFGSGSLTFNGGTAENSSIRFKQAINNDIQLPVTLLDDVDVDVATGGSVSFTKVISSPSNASFTKRGGGQVNLYGNDANTYTGTTEVVSGTLELGKAPGQAPNDYGAAVGDLVIDAGALVRLAGWDQIRDNATVTINGGRLTLQGSGEGLGHLSLANATIDSTNNGFLVTRASGNASINVTAGASSITPNIGLGAPTTVTTVANSSVTLSGALYASSANAQLNFAGSGTATLAGSAANTYSGTTIVDGGTLNLNKTGGSAIAGPLVVNSGARVNIQQPSQTYGRGALYLNGAATVDMTSVYDDFGLITFDGNGGQLIASGGSGFGCFGVTVQNGTATIACAFSSDTLLPLTTAAGATLNVTGRIPDLFPPAQSTAVVKDGLGTLILGGSVSNSFTGGLTINAGTVVMAKPHDVTAVPGNVLVKAGATLRSTQTSNMQSTITLDGGTWDLGVNAESMRTVAINNGGSIIAPGVPEFGFNVYLYEGQLTSANNASISAKLRIRDGYTFNVTSGTLAINSEMSVDAGATAGFIKSGAGTMQLSAANSYTGQTRVDAGTLRVTGSIASSGSVSVAGTLDAAATTSFAPYQSIKSLSVQAGGKAIVSGAALVIGDNTAAVSFSLAAANGSTPAARIDVKTGGLILDYAAGFGRDATTLSFVRANLLSGGIFSSTAAANDLTLGYGWTADLSGVVGTTYLGKPNIDASSVVVRPTYAGDVTLNGVVNFDDLIVLAQNYNKTGRTWTTGDVTYDGIVNFDDLIPLAQHYNRTVGALGLSAEESAALPSGFASDFALAQSLVPEPATLALIGVATAVTRRRR